MRQALALVFIVLSCLPFKISAQKEINNLLLKMVKEMEAIKEVEFEIHSKERFDEEMISSVVRARLKVNPLNVYIYCVDPNPGVEILYVQNENHNRALVNPNGFPYVNLSMSPYASKMRKNKHHTILALGFESGAKLMRQTIKKSKSSPDCYIHDKGKVQKNGYDFQVIEIGHKDFAYQKVVVDAAISVEQLAVKHEASEYLILEKNGLKENAKLKAGDEIWIPNHFAKKITLFVDQRSFLPLIQIFEDDKGVFEHYEYRNVRVNPGFKSDTFSKHSPDYNF